MANKLGSAKEVPISSGTPLVAGTMVVNADTNNVVVAPSNLTAAALATLLGCSAIKSIDLPARSARTRIQAGAYLIEEPMPDRDRISVLEAKIAEAQAELQALKRGEAPKPATVSVQEEKRGVQFHELVTERSPMGRHWPN